MGGLALAVALRAAAAGSPTFLLSGEMDEPRLRERALALQAKVSIDDLRQGRLDEAARAALGAAAIAQRDLRLRVAALLDGAFGEIEAALAAAPGAALLVVDALQLLEPPRASPRQEERAAVATRWLKSLAVRSNVAVLAVSHLPQHRATRPDPRPALDDFGARGAIKQLFDAGVLSEGDSVIITSGDHMELHGATNTLRLLKVGPGGRAEGLGEL